MDPSNLRIMEIDDRFIVAIRRGDGCWSPLTWHHSRRDAQRDVAVLSLKLAQGDRGGKPPIPADQRG
ncbi:MAG TPA: hypothetical protein VED46_15870 [Alphaproteobacteria bacterium]|nr:hypothetical protein [Alphaproteobacteria bacterium]